LLYGVSLESYAPFFLRSSVPAAGWKGRREEGGTAEVFIKKESWVGSYSLRNLNNSSNVLNISISQCSIEAFVEFLPVGQFLTDISDLGFSRVL